jgi:hypothetical protein
MKMKKKMEIFGILKPFFEIEIIEFKLHLIYLGTS